MKKTYINPAIEIQTAEAVQMMALSILDGKATEDDALTKSCDWDVWGDEDNTEE